MYYDNFMRIPVFGVGAFWVVFVWVFLNTIYWYQVPNSTLSYAMCRFWQQLRKCTWKHI